MKISIVTISYNQAGYLEETILSVLNQDYSKLEYIIIDGGSSDGSIDIIKKYESQLAFWVSQKDKGPADALNKGFAQATGDFFFYLNSDDQLLPSSISKVVKFISDNPGFDVYYGHGFMKNEKNHTTSKIYSDLWSLYGYRYGRVSIIQQATFISKQAYLRTKGFNLNNKTCWDGELLVDLALSGAKFKRYFSHVALFRIHDDSITGSGERNDLHQRTRQEINDRIDQHTQFIFKSRFIATIWEILNDPIIKIKKWIAASNRKSRT